MAKRDEIKKIADISNEGTKYNNLKSTAKVANITERFDDTTHNDNPYDDAIQYLAKKVEDVIEESNLQGTASGSYNTEIKNLTLASGSFSTRVTANDAKVSTGADLAPGTDGGVLKATVEENRGVYTLLFTFTTSDGRTTKTAKTTMS